MKAHTRIIFLDDKGDKFFGEGPCRLLHAVESTGSLRSAAFSMGMAYTKALKLLNQAEAALGFPLTTRSTGGRSGGGTTLTPEGKAWLLQYEAYREACVEANQRLYCRFFPSQSCRSVGCVILASGLGKRFGGNKLLAEFRGKPLIQWVLDATAIFPHRIVVTRHGEIEALCREQGIPCLLHQLPYRSDTVRLGLEALGDGLAGYLFCPADQPLIGQETLRRLAEAHSDSPEAIWRPAFAGKPGSPVLFPRWAYRELTALKENQGGSAVIKRYPEKIETIPVQSARELMDVDTSDDLLALESGL